MFNRIAFLKLCCPGDILFTTPAIRAVKNKFPDSNLFYITGNYSKFVPEHNPHIEKTIIVNPPFELSYRFLAGASFARAVRLMAKEKLDLVISFHRSMIVSSMAVIGLTKKVLSFATAWPMVDYSVKFNPHQHEILRYLDLVSVIGVNPEGRAMEYETKMTEDEEAKNLLRKKNIDGEFAVIAPGGGENPGTVMHIKRWAALNYKNISQYIQRRYKLPVVAVGSLSERELAETISPNINLAGKTSFELLAAILKRAAIVIGNDSGPLYLASAVGAKTIIIYGPSSSKLLEPFSNFHRSISNPIECQPCYHPQKVERGHITCATGTLSCMLNIKLRYVEDAIDELLKE